MRDEWKQMTLREAGVSLIDCDHRTPPAAAGGYPYVAIPQLKQGRIVLSDVRHITKSHFLEWTKKNRPRPYDVVVSRRCNPGETAFVPQGLEFALGQNLVLLRSDDSKVFPPFLRWLLRSQGWWEQVGKFINVGAVFDSLRCADIPNFQLLFPPLPEQQAIADILGSLDDKIELNRRMNETLESMARALFKSWFVDFDPVVAKSEGRHPEGMDAETAKLFPDSFEDSEIGRIPKGWRLVAADEVAEINAWSLGKNDNLDLIEYVEISEVNRGDIRSTQCFERGSEPSRARRRLRHGDTVMSTVRPDRGSYFLCLHPTPNLIASTGFAVLSPTTVPWSYLHAGLTQPEVFERLGQHADGGAYPAVRPEVMGNWTMCIPDNEDVLRAFHMVCAPLFEMACSNRKQTQTLSSVRDLLLPNLLSGELNTHSV